MKPLRRQFADCDAWVASTVLPRARQTNQPLLALYADLGVERHRSIRRKETRQIRKAGDRRNPAPTVVAGMRIESSGADRRLVILLIVAGLHALMILALIRARPEHLALGEGQALTLIFIPEVLRRIHPVPLSPIPSTPRPMRREDEAPLGMPATAQGSASPISPAPAIDWKRAAAQSAAVTVDEAIRGETRMCSSADTDPAWLPKCNPPAQPKFDWAPPRAGFSGGLPYVRMGEKCVVTIGLFACGFGGDPPVNGDLFESMRDPERDRSSVPDVGTPGRQR